MELSTNAHVYVTNDLEYKFKCTEDRIYVNSDIILRLKTNDRIYLDYGKIELAVIRVGKYVFVIIFYCYNDERDFFLEAKLGKIILSFSLVQTKMRCIV